MPAEVCCVVVELIISSFCLAVAAGVFLNNLFTKFLFGAVSGLHLTIALSSLLGCITCIIGVSSLQAKFILSCITISMIITYFIIGWFIEKANVRFFYDERIRLFQASIMLDPKNLGARTYLAETYYKIGRLEDAVGEMADILEIAPGDTAAKHKLKMWLYEYRREHPDSAYCSYCGYLNEYTAFRCYKCNRLLSLHGAPRKKNYSVLVTLIIAFMLILVTAMLGYPALVRIALMFVIISAWLVTYFKVLRKG